MNVTSILHTSALASTDRFGFWEAVIAATGASCIAELGVHEGLFAERMLRSSAQIDRYYMIDPWRHLDDWNKPYNTDDATFEGILESAMARTAFASDRRYILRGRTSEVISSIDDDSLDLAYVDGDHTLRGITIDLIQLWPKMKDGGVIGGDDFRSPTRFWSGRGRFEPTLVFPWAVHFAEAMRQTIYGLPHSQFACTVDKSGEGRFDFHDITGSYGSTELRTALLAARTNP